MFSLYVVIDIITVALLAALMLLALSHGGYKLRLNRRYAILAVMVAIWLPANHIGGAIYMDKTVAVWANYLVFGCSFVASLMTLKIISSVAKLPRERAVLRIAEPFLWIMAMLSFSPFVGAGVVQGSGAVAGVIFGPLAATYGVLLLVMICFMIEIVIQGYRKRQGVVKRQLRSIGIAIGMAAPLILILSFVLPFVTDNFDFTEFGTTPMVLFVAGLYYAVLRQRLFDVRSTTIRAVGYVLSMSVIAVLYITMVYGVSQIFFHGRDMTHSELSQASMAVSLILVFFFQPIRRFFDKLTNAFFYRGEYDQEVFLHDFGRIVSYDTDLRVLLRRVSLYIVDTMGSERVFFHIVGRPSVGAPASRFPAMSDHDLKLLEKYYTDNYDLHEVIVVRRLPKGEVKTVLDSYHISMALPLVLQNQFIGCLFIGDHKSRGYTMRDVQTLEAVANELIIAIQNSLSIEEIRELNATLQHRVSEATKELRSSNRQLQRLDEAKNEFISMASHQLRTPLTSIKGYLDMLLEGDLGRLTPTQKTVLNEAFMSSERMVQLINDFLNISRLQTGKFVISRRLTNIGSMVREEAALLGVVARQRNVKLKVKIGKNIPEMNVDVEKLRQVVMNMIDNAIYYSKENGAVQISVDRTDNDVVFTVRDRGIGVPKSEQAGLFSKFFRASNARKRRPDGTGVGLFLARKVVLLHGGSVIFESEEGKGSTFGFRLPIN